MNNKKFKSSKLKLFVKIILYFLQNKIPMFVTFI